MRRVSWIFGLIVLVAASCDYPRLPRLTMEGGPGGDAAVDSAPPAPDSCTSFATLLPLDTCQLRFDGDLTISGGTVVYDTGTHMLTVGSATIPVTHATVTLDGESVEVISARSVTLDLILFGVVGPLPLVIAASTDIRVGDGALLDVSNGGAGARTSCVNGALPGAPDIGGAAGGGGGGYGADGGRGGDGNSNGTNGASAGGAKGSAITAVPSGLRGGCPGASGGKGDDSGGAGGKAGGALYLVAAGRIGLGRTGALNAGGGPGLGSVHTSAGGDAGGGGGGSGGMLVLEAPHIVGPAATITANGGGGGGGGDPAVAGNDGSSGTLTTARASGGGGGGNGIPGGRGGSKDFPAGEDVTRVDVSGGGGGGGGVGIIRVKSADLQLGVISPDPR